MTVENSVLSRKEEERKILEAALKELDVEKETVQKRLKELN